VGDPSKRADDVTCLACGCLCDDIALEVEGGRILAAHHACDLGRAAFLAEPPNGPDATIDGQAAGRDEALARAAEILKAARCPLITGLSGSTLEAQAEAVALADHLGATIDPAHSADAMPGLAALQRVGRVGASLGEVRNRADVVIFWGVDPVTTHPRHLERYSVEPAGRFIAGKRTVLVADAAPTATAARADRFLAFDPGRQFEALRMLRSLLHGLAPDDATIRDSCGIEPGELRPWFEAMAAASYGAFFSGSADAATTEEALQLVRDLNAQEGRRFVALRPGRPGNPAGAEAALTWAAGAPLAVDFGRGFPRFLPDEATAGARLSRGEADAALIVGNVPERLSPEAREHLDRIPVVVIAPDATQPERAATVGLATARTGIEAGGTVMRIDGVTLPLRAVIESTRPSEAQLLSALRKRITAGT
jgi:formylmethanofuran dehydrogenase subunit B